MWVLVVLAPFALHFQLPTGESGTAGANANPDDSDSFARPLAPPEVGPPVSVHEGEEDEESDVDGQDEEEEEDEALVEAVEKLLREVEVRRKSQKKENAVLRWTIFAAVGFERWWCLVS